MTFLKGRRTGKAVQKWRDDIIRRDGQARVFRAPDAGARPGIRQQPRADPKAVTARFYQILSGHAMTAVFVKEKWGWTDSDQCWWCGRGRAGESLHHLEKRDQDAMGGCGRGVRLQK